MKKEKYLNEIIASLDKHTFVKVSLANYRGKEIKLKKIIAKKIILKNKENLSFIYRYTDKDITKNYSLEDGIARIKRYFDVGQFNSTTLCTTQYDITLDYLKNGKIKWIKNKATRNRPASLRHDRQKKRAIPPDRKYLEMLGISSKTGVVYHRAQSKYKQINQYIEILSNHLEELTKEERLEIVDMGAGKGYLSFALYDYLHNSLGISLRMTGVEYREELVSLCNSVARACQYSGLRFVRGIIKDYEMDRLDILIALHACDTATDEAIYKGVQGSASLIVVAPCCHKQLRRAIKKQKTKNELSPLTHYGIFLEEQAVMLTDTIRCLVLNYYGYKTKVVQFISDQHTPKNIMIIASKKNHPSDIQKIKAKIEGLKNYFGIEAHHLESLLPIK